MKILVTGGAGYVGSVLCPMLLDQGHEVLCFDSFRHGVGPLLGFVTHPSLTIVHGDVRDMGALKGVVRQADAVIHLAAIVGYPACAAEPHDAESTNVGGTRLLCDLLSQRQRFLFASTGSTYGRVEGTADEETPINPLTLYGRTKRDGEAMARDAGGVCLRFATLFGVSPRLRLDLLVNDFCYQAFHHRQIVIFEGRHCRTFLHVRDAARVYPFALDHFEQMKGSIYNVGSSAMNYTKIDVAQAIRRRHDFYLHEADVGKDLDERNYHVSFAKLEALGFRGAISLDDGIVEMLKVVPYLKVKNEWRNL